MEYKIKIYKKNGYRAFSDKDEDILILENSPVSIKINKSKSTSTNEAQIVAEFEHLPMASFQGGSNGIIDNFAKIEIYFNNKIQFTGVIKKYEYDELQKTVNLTCNDMIYRLLNVTDKTLNYENTTALAIIEDIVQKAGLTFYRKGGTNYPVNKLDINIGTTYLDIITSFLETIYGSIRAGKDGTILLEDQYPDYTEGGGDINHFDWTYTSDINNSSAIAGRDASLMKNLLKINCDKNYDIYEDPSMTSYLNNEKWLDFIENALANTQQKRKAVVGYKFLEMWRNSTPLTIIPTKGNEDVDIGQVVKLIRDNTLPGYYLLVGIDTEVSADGYSDTLQLQGMRDKRTIYEIPVLITSGIDKEVAS
ncbi:hypothetical protein [Clostridium scatologenes]|uniref:Uncharacterized protein n=1 Tax=Clostridium scatologenes TaxID=1548 RepID=A0A0E3M6Y0_CLOSL|nr:hypothetical protein [Clostridium scatologenes]AKA70128.1 hypothetical protein CSCA_3003 [Clostridium scatologenes]